MKNHYLLTIAILVFPLISSGQAPETPPDFKLGESFKVSQNAEAFQLKTKDGLSCFIGQGQAFTGAPTERYFHAGKVTVKSFEKDNQVKINFESESGQKHLNTCPNGEYQVAHSQLVRHKFKSQSSENAEASGVLMPRPLGAGLYKVDDPKRPILNTNHKWDCLLPGQKCFQDPSDGKDTGTTK
jgi:hypothetical protein